MPSNLWLAHWGQRGAGRSQAAGVQLGGLTVGGLGSTAGLWGGAERAPDGHGLGSGRTRTYHTPLCWGGERWFFVVLNHMRDLRCGHSRLYDKKNLDKQCQ